jgi:CRP-like cAMP-binding protein
MGDDRTKQAIEMMRDFICFSGFDDRQFNDMAGAGFIRTMRMERALCYQDDMADKVFLLIEGSVRKVRWREDSTSKVIGKGLSGDWIGLSEAITGDPYLFDAITEEESIIFLIDKNRFLKLMDMKEFIRMVNRELARGYHDLYSEMDSHTPIQKIMRYIKTYVETFDIVDEATNNPIIEVTQENIAESIGVTRETVSKYLRQLQDKGIIATGRGRIEVIDKDGLDSVEI